MDIGIIILLIILFIGTLCVVFQRPLVDFLFRYCSLGSLLDKLNGAFLSHDEKERLKQKRVALASYAVTSLKRGFYEALCVLHASGVSSTQKYEAHFVLASFARQASKYMKHACRRMKRILFRLHIFLPWNQGKKNGRGCFNCSENVSQTEKGCKLVKNAHCFVKLRKYLCFCLFMQQRKIFYSTERTFSPKQLQNAPKKDGNLRLLQTIKNGILTGMNTVLKFRMPCNLIL